MTATTIVNAAGPFVDELNEEWGVRSDHRIVYSKGIHLVVPRLTTTEHHKVLAFFDDIAARGSATVLLDLAPGRSQQRLAADLARPRAGTVWCRR